MPPPVCPIKLAVSSSSACSLVLLMTIGYTLSPSDSPFTLISPLLPSLFVLVPPSIILMGAHDNYNNAPRGQGEAKR